MERRVRRRNTHHDVLKTKQKEKKKKLKAFTDIHLDEIMFSLAVNHYNGSLLLWEQILLL